MPAFWSALKKILTNVLSVCNRINSKFIYLVNIPTLLVESGNKRTGANLPNISNGPYAQHFEVHFSCSMYSIRNDERAGSRLLFEQFMFLSQVNVCNIVYRK